MVGAAGIEPATICSQSRYATAALRPGDSNYPTRYRAGQRDGGAGVGVFGVGARLLGGGVGVFVEVGVGVAVPVGVSVGVSVGGTGVFVAVFVAVFVGVSVGGTGVFVGVSVAVLVGLAGVAVNVLVEDGGGVVGDGVGVAGRGVGVGEGVSLGVGVGVGVPDGHSTTMNSTVLFCTFGPPWNCPSAASHVAVSVMVPPFLPWSLSCVKSNE